MIDSINPNNLLEFGLEVANWWAQRGETLEDELGSVLHVIRTFCDNNEDPIYKGAAIVCEQALVGVLDYVSNVDVEIEASEPTDKTEEVENDSESNGAEPDI